MKIYDLDTKEGRFYAYVEIHRVLREFDNFPSAKQIAEKIDGDPAQIAHALKKMSEYGGVHREEVKRRTENTPEHARFRYWNKKAWREAIETKFRMTVPADSVASKRVQVKEASPKVQINEVVKMPTKVITIRRVGHGVDLKSLSVEQKQALFHDLAKDLIPADAPRLVG